jgi:cytochrome c oxidase subunit 1
MEATTAYKSYLDVKPWKNPVLNWILSTDHKRIGLMYLGLMLFFFCCAMSIGFFIKLEKLVPGGWLYGARVYNSLFTLHGVIMVFLFIVPGLPAVFGNFMMPILIGAKDVAFPRLNLATLYIFFFGSVLIIISLLIGTNGPADTGWTFTVPYSSQTQSSVGMALFAVFMLGWGTILTSLNFIVTIHRMRAPGMDFFKMPLFVWAVYATSWIQVLATPVVGVTLLLLALERVLPVGFFDPSKGGDPVLFQHLFWIYSHPAVYIMILPAMGAISEIIPTFTRRTIFGYKAIAMSSLSIAGIGYFVWAHHMFVTGVSDLGNAIFSFLTFFVGVPTAIKVFNWVASMYKGSIQLDSPMLFVLGFIFNFTIGGLTGLLLGVLSADVHVHGTDFIVAHFHYTMFGGAATAFFGALHYWYPKMFGKMYNETKAKIAFWWFMIGFQWLYFPMFVLGLMGMPRRYYDYLPEFTALQQISTVGSWVMVSGLLFMFWNLIQGLRKGVEAPHNPWGGITLEWKLPFKTPSLFNFEHEEPVITKGPYDFTGEHRL